VNSTPDLSGFSPNHPATADRSRIKPKFKCVRNADRTGHLEASAAVREIADHAVDHRGTMCKNDLRSFQHSPAGSLSAGLHNWANLMAAPTRRVRGRGADRCGDPGGNSLRSAMFRLRFVRPPRHDPGTGRLHPYRCARHRRRSTQAGSRRRASAGRDHLPVSVFRSRLDDCGNVKRADELSSNAAVFFPS
jgi:hypothetical protein